MHVTYIYPFEDIHLFKDINSVKIPIHIYNVNLQKGDKIYSTKFIQVDNIIFCHSPTTYLMYKKYYWIEINLLYYWSNSIRVSNGRSVLLLRLARSMHDWR